MRLDEDILSPFSPRTIKAAEAGAATMEGVDQENMRPTRAVEGRVVAEEKDEEDGGRRRRSVQMTEQPSQGGVDLDAFREQFSNFRRTSDGFVKQTRREFDNAIFHYRNALQVSGTRVKKKKEHGKEAMHPCDQIPMLMIVACERRNDDGGGGDIDEDGDGNEGGSKEGWTRRLRTPPLSVPGNWSAPLSCSSQQVLSALGF